MDLSLAHNSIGFYQLSKLACIPIIIVVEYILYHTTVALTKLMAVAVIVVGVGMASVNDVTVDLVGVLLAAVAVGFTAMGLILCSRYQKDLECSAMQLLHNTCPLVTLGMMTFIPFFHDVHQPAQVEFSAPLVAHISGSCVLALGVNTSNFLLLGQISPLAYQVLGHLKTSVIFILGFAVFRYQYNARVIVGTVMALGGVVAYTELGRRKVTAARHAKEVKEEEEEGKEGLLVSGSSPPQPGIKL